MNDTATAASTDDTGTRQPVIDIHYVGFLTVEELRVKTPGVVLPTELINWLKSYSGVDKLAVQDDDQLGQTDYAHFTWTEDDNGNFGSVLIEMICTYFGWDRPDVNITGGWTEEDDEIAYAKEALATTVPPLKERVLVLAPGLGYTVRGSVEVTQVGDNTVIRVV